MRSVLAKVLLARSSLLRSSLVAVGLLTTVTVVGCGGGSGGKPDASDARGDTASNKDAGTDGAAVDSASKSDAGDGAVDASGSDAAGAPGTDAADANTTADVGTDAKDGSATDAITTDVGADGAHDAGTDTGTSDGATSDGAAADAKPLGPVINPLGAADKLYWAESITGKDTEYVEDATVVSGDVVVVGDFSEEIVFAKGMANETRFTTPKLLDSDVFYARYRPDGSLVWAKRFGGTGFDDSAAVAAAPDGGFVIVGRIEGQVTLDAGGTHETTLDAGAGRDLFVARFDGNGSLVWARRAGSDSDSVGGNAVRVLADGSVIVAGYMVGSTVFAPGEANETTVAATGTYDDMFVARYTSAGALSWVKSGGAGGTSSTLSEALAITSSTEATVTGYFSGTVVLGKGETKQTSLISAGGEDIFIARYTLADGALVSAVRLGGNGDDEPHAVESKGDGALTVAGVFSGTVAFGAGTGQTLMTSAMDDLDVFVAQFAANGTLSWVRRAGGTDFDSAEGLALASDGSVLVTGGFGLTASFPGSTPAQLVASGPSDGFLVRYAADGTPGAVTKLGGTEYDYGAAISILGDGSLIWTGAFGGTVTVGTGEANATTLTAAGTHGDLFLLHTR